MRMVIASRNAHKIQELKILFQGLPVEVFDLNDFPEAPPLEETGETFQLNAFQKARDMARFTGSLTLADDSGLEVEALQGAPGIYSARYASLTGGGNASDEANNQKLLHELHNVPLHQRQARYVCVLALVEPKSGKEWSFEGFCGGTILLQGRGQKGFGYDPLFYLPDLKCTMAEVSMAEKNLRSHRAQAMQNLIKVFPKILRELQEGRP